MLYAIKRIQQGMAHFLSHVCNSLRCCVGWLIGWLVGHRSIGASVSDWLSVYHSFSLLVRFLICEWFSAKLPPLDGHVVDLISFISLMGDDNKSIPWCGSIYSISFRFCDYWLALGTASGSWGHIMTRIYSCLPLTRNRVRVSLFTGFIQIKR